MTELLQQYAIEHPQKVKSVETRSSSIMIANTFLCVRRLGGFLGSKLISGTYSRTFTFPPSRPTRTIDGVLHPTFKDVCYAMGFLDDDKEYIDGKNEATRWSSDLILGGRTAHYRFAIPLDCHQSSTRNIMQGSGLANLLVHTKLIVWDESPMAHKYFFKALYRSLGDIMGNHNLECYKKPFSGKFVMFGGDFRQILPIIPKGSRQDIVLSSLNSSSIWESCKVFTLTKNMRLDTLNDEKSKITIHDNILISSYQDPIEAIVVNTYPSFFENYNNHDYSCDSAILTPTLDDVASVNNYMLSLLPGQERIYLNSERICNQDQDFEPADVYPTEFVNTIFGSGLPYHELKLKVEALIMLLRNIDKSMGLCNGTMLIITRLCKHVVEATIILGKFIGERVIIAQMLISPSNSRLPYWFQRQQFLIV
ncbi:ATP-dependent DNA helicase PIF1-like [Senna tora]|uniref:ATP-dependent DNA helicase n=1 Tax=Senna tora TaxID=362788 RepID=A0A834WAJ5_9FABA|nr:ATP-dependent DNA helicase PIF1-like [Senna tora]